MRTPTAIVAILAAVSLLPAIATAKTPSKPEKPVDQVDLALLRYNVHPSLQKLGRGVANTLTGWMEVPLNIHKRYNENDAATSFFYGAGLGVVRGVARTGVGLYEALTFWLPYPEEFKPILPPLDYFKLGDERREPLPLE